MIPWALYEVVCEDSKFYMQAKGGACAYCNASMTALDLVSDPESLPLNSRDDVEAHRDTVFGPYSRS